MKPALLVIDVQKRFFKKPETAASLNNAIEYINAALELFRSKNLPVFCVQHVDETDGLVPGDEGFDLPVSLNIRADDPHIHKTYGNSFNKTALADMLRKQDVDTVIITGFCAEYCILSTCRGAEDYDFAPIILRGALASRTPANIPFVENINEVISYDALCAVLK